MSPSERPSNDNQGALPEREPGLFSTRQRAIESTFSLCVIAALIAFSYSVLDAAHWKGVGITLGIAVVGMTIAAIYRLIVYGRA